MHVICWPDQDVRISTRSKELRPSLQRDVHSISVFTTFGGTWRRLWMCKVLVRGQFPKVGTCLARLGDPGSPPAIQVSALLCTYRPLVDNKLNYPHCRNSRHLSYRDLCISLIHHTLVIHNLLRTHLAYCNLLHPEFVRPFPSLALGQNAPRIKAPRPR